MFFIAFDLITISILHHTNGQHLYVIVRLPSSFSLRYFVGWFISILPLESTEEEKNPHTGHLPKIQLGGGQCGPKPPEPK